MGRSKDFKEEEVLRKAMECFWQNGYEATSTRDLANAMGISYGSVYNTFGDKRTLYLAALDLSMGHYSTEIVTTLDHASSARAALTELLTRAIEASVAEDSSCSASHAVLSLAQHDPEVATKVRTINQAIEQAIERLLTRAYQVGEVSLTSSAADVAHFMTTMLSGICMTARLSNSPDQLRRMAQVALSVL